MLFMNNAKIISDKCPPWGTPKVALKLYDLEPKSLTHWRPKFKKSKGNRILNLQV